MDRQKLDDVVFQSIRPFELTDRIVRRLKVEIGVGTLPLATYFVSELFLPQILGFDELGAGLIGDVLHLIDEGLGLLIGDGRTNNKQRLVELHAAILLDKGPRNSRERGVACYLAQERWTVTQDFLRCQ